MEASVESFPVGRNAGSFDDEATIVDEERFFGQNERTYEIVHTPVHTPQDAETDVLYLGRQLIR